MTADQWADLKTYCAAAALVAVLIGMAIYKMFKYRSFGNQTPGHLTRLPIIGGWVLRRDQATVVIKFHCIRCGVSIKAAPDRAGVVTKCPQCSATIQVPNIPPIDIDSTPLPQSPIPLAPDRHSSPVDFTKAGANLMVAGCLLTFLLPMLFLVIIFVIAMMGGASSHKP